MLGKLAAGEVAVWENCVREVALGKWPNTSNCTLNLGITEMKRLDPQIKSVHNGYQAQALWIMNIQDKSRRAENFRMRYP